MSKKGCPIGKIRNQKTGRCITQSKTNYDYEVKHISKTTGLTGIESKHIVNQLTRQGLDYQMFDWKTIGEDLYGYGKRTEGVKHKLRAMYGVSLETKERDKHEISKYTDMEVSNLMPVLMNRNDRRKKKARIADYSKGAKETFKPTDKEGVEKWKKHPNKYDIEGIDDLIE